MSRKAHKHCMLHVTSDAPLYAFSIACIAIHETLISAAANSGRIHCFGLGAMYGRGGHGSVLNMGVDEIMSYTTSAAPRLADVSVEPDIAYNL